MQFPLFIHFRKPLVKRTEISFYFALLNFRNLQPYLRLFMSFICLLVESFCVLFFYFNFKLSGVVVPGGVYFEWKAFSILYLLTTKNKLNCLHGNFPQDNHWHKDIYTSTHTQAHAQDLPQMGFRECNMYILVSKERPQNKRENSNDSPSSN